MSFTISMKGDFSKTEKWLEKVKEIGKLGFLDEYGKLGVAMLEENTPKRTGLTSRSWSYSIVRNDEGTSLVFNNSNIQGNVNVAVIIQTGHGTSRGVYVKGRDYINPSLQPIFDSISESIDKEVKNL